MQLRKQNQEFKYQIQSYELDLDNLDRQRERVEGMLEKNKQENEHMREELGIFAQKEKKLMEENLLLEQESFKMKTDMEKFSQNSI